MKVFAHRSTVAAALAVVLCSCVTHSPTVATTAPTRVVASGSTWTVDATTRLNALTIAPNATITAPKGKSLTMTVNGIETGIASGSYSGNVVLTVSVEHVVSFSAFGSANTTHHFRQALFLDASGVVADKSVLAAAGKYRLQNGTLSGVNIQSVGANFNGLVATGGQYMVKNPIINFTGNGGNDFAGYGAAVLSTGKGTRLVLDGAKIHTHGVVRTAAVADNGSQLIVKNSQLDAHNGVLPAGYRSNVSPGEMMDVPWMLGLSGNVRTTNLLGNGTTATYINSSIASEGWGVLSVDASENAKLTAINSKISNTGSSGYGSYVMGGSLNRFYGTEFNVADYALIVTGGNAVFAASTPDNVRRINDELQLGLSQQELRALPHKATKIKSARFGVMWHSQGTVTVTDDTVFDTAETTFEVKGVKAEINVDGAKGAEFKPGNGVLVQVMDNDDPGPVMEDGLQLNTGVYHEPVMPPTKVENFDVTTVNASDVIANLSNIHLQGNMFNATYGGNAGGSGAPPAAVAGPGVLSGDAPAAAGDASGGAAPPPPGDAGGRNLIINLDHATLAGVVSASTANHPASVIASANYKLIGEVTNIPGPVVNNGVQVHLTQSTWTVTGASYLSKLVIDPTSKIVAPRGSTLTLRVNGTTVPVQPGSYQGEIELNLVSGAVL
jgi:hypothetical protein